MTTRSYKNAEYDQFFNKIADIINERQAPWRAKAACLGSTDQFFPTSGVSKHHIARIRAVCQTCPVKVECDEYANSLEVSRLSGMWAGQTNYDRRAAQRQTVDA